MGDPVGTEEAFRRYLITSGKSKETARSYSDNLRIFLRWCATHEVSPEALERGAIEHYISDQLSAVAKQTVRNRLFAVRCFYDFLATRPGALVEANPTAGIHIKRPKTAPRQPVSLNDQRRLAFNTHSVRDEAIVMLLIDTGLRIGELTAMRIENIDWDAGLVVIDGKGDKQREIWPNENVMALLRQVTAGRRKGPVWLTMYGQPLTRDAARKNFYRLAARSRVNAYPHKLRVSFANSFLEEGGDIGALKEAMGHADIQTTAHYAGATERARAQATVRRINLAGRLLA